MIRLEHTVIIPLPLDQVFAYAADYRTWPEWFVGLSDVRPTTTTPGDNGARYAYKVRMMSVTAGVETEIREFVRNVGWIGVGTRGIPHRTHWHFESLQEGTRFTYGLEGGGPGAVDRPPPGFLVPAAPVGQDHRAVAPEPEAAPAGPPRPGRCLKGSAEGQGGRRCGRDALA